MIIVSYKNPNSNGIKLFNQRDIKTIKGDNNYKEDNKVTFPQDDPTIEIDETLEQDMLL